MSTKSSETIIAADLDGGFCAEIASMPGGQNVRRCFACGTCAAGCPVTAIDDEYNCRTIIRKIQFGMRKEVLSSPTLWLCVMCYRCHSRCPQQVNFTDIMRALRHLAVKEGYAPVEMLSQENEFDRQAQLLRRTLVKKAVPDAAAVSTERTMEAT